MAFFGQKGGSGKTTLAVHVAVAAQQAGKRVAILDLDPQGSALGWYRSRGLDATPLTVAVPDSQLKRAIEGAEADGFDLVVVDSPPHAAPVAARIVAAADLVVVPVRPSPMDVAALPATVQLIGSRPSVFVLSSCPPRAPEIEETRQLLGQYKRPVFGPITERRPYFRALTAGQAVSEFEPAGPASAEIRALCSALFKEIGI